MESDADKIQCLERVIAINPTNEAGKRAQAGLEQLQAIELPDIEHIAPPKKRSQPPRRYEEEEEEDEEDEEDEDEDEDDDEEYQPRRKKRKKKPRSLVKSTIIVLTTTILFLGVLCVIGNFLLTAANNKVEDVFEEINRGLTLTPTIEPYNVLEYFDITRYTQTMREWLFAVPGAQRDGNTDAVETVILSTWQGFTIADTAPIKPKLAGNQQLEPEFAP